MEKLFYLTAISNRISRSCHTAIVRSCSLLDDIASIQISYLTDLQLSDLTHLIQLHHHRSNVFRRGCFSPSLSLIFVDVRHVVLNGFPSLSRMSSFGWETILSFSILPARSDLSQLRSSARTNDRSRIASLSL